MQKQNDTFEFLVGADIADFPTKISAFIKVAVRDMIKHVTSKGYISIPAEYATNGNDSTYEIAQYLAYGDPSTAVDFLDINNRG